MRAPASPPRLTGSPHGRARRILLRLLAPDGPLLRAASKVDSELQLKFVFPTERLPVRTQMLLRSAEGTRALSMLPTYAGKLSMVNAQAGYELHTTVLGYYFLWFTYYVVKGAGSPAAAPSPWASPGAHPHQWAGGGGGGVGSPFQALRTPDVLHIKTSSGRRHPYLELFIMYMSVYLPSPERVAPALSARMAAAAAGALDPGEAAGAHGARDRGPGGSPSGRMQKLHPTASFGEGAHACAEYNGVRGADALLLSTAVDAWLSDLAARDAGAGGSPGRGMRQGAAGAMKRGYQTPYQPPPEDLLASLRLLVKYLIDPRDEMGAGCGHYRPAAPAPALRSPQKAANGAAHRRTAAEVRESVCIVRRPLYGMLRTAFREWPNESTSRMSPMVDVLMAFIAPWVVRGSRPPAQQKDSIAGHLSAVVGRAAGAGAGGPKRGELDERWLEHVADNIPFYSILLDGFLNLQYRRASMFPDSVARQLARVFGHLSGYPQVMKIVSEAEAAYGAAADAPLSSPRAGQPTAAAQRVLAQLGELEGAHRGASLALFSEGMHGGASLAAAILQSLQSACANGKLEKRRLVDAQDSCARFFGKRVHPSFGEAHAQASPGNPPSPRGPEPAADAGGGTPPANGGGAELRQRRPPGGADGRAGGAGGASIPKSSWRDVRYKGDWMHRPMGENEIPLLSNFFIRLSDRINGMRLVATPVNLRSLGEVQTVACVAVLLAILALVWWLRSLLAPSLANDVRPAFGARRGSYHYGSH